MFINIHICLLDVLKIECDDQNYRNYRNLVICNILKGRNFHKDDYEKQKTN